MYLRSLVNKGLVVREIDDSDLRRHRLATSSRGREVLAEALEALAGGFSTMLERVDETDRSELRRILLALLEPEARPR